MRLDETAILRHHEYLAPSYKLKFIGCPDTGAFSSNELKFDWRIVRWYLVRKKIEPPIP
jgi:hypothetical protein